MPLRAAQILLRAPLQGTASELLQRALRRQKAPATGARELLALQSGGWLSLLERGRVDWGLARLVSEGVPGEVLALDLDGGRLALKLRRFREGEPLATQEEPEPRGELLPIFRDVEELAWLALREAGVPASLRLLLREEVRLLGAEGDGLQGVLLQQASTGVTAAAQRCLGPERTEGALPPVHPDSLVESRAHEVRALEVRTLPPLLPDAEAARALAGLEEQQALRLCLQLGGEAQGPRLPRPAFAYRGVGDDLLALLGPAREERPWLQALLDPGRPAPLSPEGLLDSARSLLARVRPELRVLRAHGTTLELSHPLDADASLLLDLRGRWEAVVRSELPEPAAGDETDPLLGELGPLLGAAPVPAARWPRARLLRGLLPTLTCEPGLAPEPLAGLLEPALLCAEGGLLVPVDAAALEAHGLTFSEALARAVENADTLTAQAPGQLLFFDLEVGRVALTDFDDPGGAGRLLSPFFRSLLLQLHGGPCLAAAPTRDTLLCCAPQDAEGVEWLRAEARRRWEEGPFPLAPGLLVLTEQGCSELLGDPSDLLLR